MTLRLLAAVVAGSILLAAAIVACNTVGTFTDCGSPNLDEKGVDGGPDPCHCDPPASLNIMACPCLSNPSDQTSIDEYNSCIVLFPAEQDGGGH